MADVDLTREIHIRVIDPTTMQSRELEHIVAGTVAIDEMIISRDIVFGQLYASKAELQIYDDTSDLVNNQIFIYALENESTKEIPIFNGIIDSCKSDRLSTYRDIVAYDRAYSLSKTNVAKWWNSFWESSTTATVQQLRTSLLREYSVSYKQKVLPNDTIEIQNTYQITSISFNNMLKMLTELSCCFPHFGRDGVLDFITLSVHGEPTVIDNNFEGDTSSFEEAPIKKYDDVAIYDVPGNLRYSVMSLTSEEYLDVKHQYDNVYQQSLIAYNDYAAYRSDHGYPVADYQMWLLDDSEKGGASYDARLKALQQQLDELASTAGGTNPYSVKDNLIIQDLDDETIKAIADNMMSVINEIEYRASDVNIIVGGANLSLGDKVSAGGNVFYVFQNTFSNSLIVDQNIKADGIIEDNETEVETVFGNVVVYKTLEEVTGKLGFAVNVLTNPLDITVLNEGEPQILCDTEIAVQSETRILIDIEVLLTVDTLEDEIYAPSISTYRDNDCVLYFKYYYDNALIESRQPIEILTDGEHIVNLHFSLLVKEDIRHYFYVTLECVGGQIEIGQNQVFATIAGQALVKDAETKDIRIDENYVALNLVNNLLGTLSDEGVVTLPEVQPAMPIDNIIGLNLLANLYASGGVTDSVGVDIPLVTFSPWVNSDLVDTDITTYTQATGWQGAGSTIAGTAKYVITADVDDVDHVTVYDHGGVFYASFDEGETWVAYTESGWQEGASMTDIELMAITPAQWAEGGTTVRLKVLLGEGFTLFSIDMFGATLHEEE